jgi:NTE family protein
VAAAVPSTALAGRVAGYDTITLALQGSVARGAYQPGVYEALDEAGVVPNRLSGISIGALDATIIAGNPPERRVARLRAFWDTICTTSPGAPWLETST